MEQEWNIKLNQLKNIITKKHNKELTEQEKWKVKYDKILSITEQIWATGYNDQLRFFIPNADILKYCKIEHKQSRGSHLSFRIYRQKESDGYEMMTWYKTKFKEDMSFSGSNEVEFSYYTEDFLDYILEEITDPDYIQSLIDE